MQYHKLISKLTCAVLCSAMLLFGALQELPVAADTEMAHDAYRDVQAEGVGNPFGYGERNTPADATTEEIRAINHAMSVQEVKYSLYKEIDEHWDLLSVRLGQPERELVYALFVGMATRESTIGGNGDGGDIETAYTDGFGVSPAHAYGPLQTAVTAFADCDPSFMPEEDVPEMFQYSLSESTFYDCIISNHMGIRKVLHFVNQSITEDGQSGYQVVRGALRGFNTGYATYADDGYYVNYSDEIIALAHWYYEEGHLYDDVFTWTGDSRAAQYREGDVWAWWGDVQPSMAEITEATLTGDVNLDGVVTVADVVLLQQYLVRETTLTEEQAINGDIDGTNALDGFDAAALKRMLLLA